MTIFYFNGSGASRDSGERLENFLIEFGGIDFGKKISPRDSGLLFIHGITSDNAEKIRKWGKGLDAFEIIEVSSVPSGINNTFNLPNWHRCRHSTADMAISSEMRDFIRNYLEKTTLAWEKIHFAENRDDLVALYLVELARKMTNDQAIGSAIYSDLEAKAMNGRTLSPVGQERLAALRQVLSEGGR